MALLPLRPSTNTQINTYASRLLQPLKLPTPPTTAPAPTALAPLPSSPAAPALTAPLVPFAPGVTHLPDAPPAATPLPLAGTPSPSPAPSTSLPPTTPFVGGSMSTGKMWQGTTKRVPLVFSQQILAGQTVQFQIIPQFAFRGENLIVDPAIAASCTVQPPTVGPNVQVAGGNNTANISGQMFPPSQMHCLDWGMDIANEGNQLSLSVTSLLTSTSMTFNAFIMGTVAEEMSHHQKMQHMQQVAAGLAPAGSFRAGISPAGSFAR